MEVLRALQMEVEAMRSHFLFPLRPLEYAVYQDIFLWNILGLIYEHVV